MKKLSFLIVMAFLAGSFSTPADAVNFKFWKKKKKVEKVEEAAEEGATEEVDEEAAPVKKKSRFSSFKRSMSQRLQRSKSSPEVTADEKEDSAAGQEPMQKEEKLNAFDLVAKNSLKMKSSLKDHFKSCKTADAFVKMLSNGRAGPGSKCRKQFCTDVCAGLKEIKDEFTDDLCMGSCLIGTPLNKNATKRLKKRYGDRIKHMDAKRYSALFNVVKDQIGEKYARLLDKDDFVQTAAEARTTQSVMIARSKEEKAAAKDEKTTDDTLKKSKKDLTKSTEAQVEAYADFVNWLDKGEGVVARLMSASADVVGAKERVKFAQGDASDIDSASKAGVSKASSYGLKRGVLPRVKHVRQAMKSSKWKIDSVISINSDTVKSVYQSLVNDIMGLQALNTLKLQAKIAMSSRTLLSAVSQLAKLAKVNVEDEGDSGSPAVGPAPVTSTK